MWFPLETLLYGKLLSKKSSTEPFQLSDSEEPPPGGLQTRVEDLPGTLSSSCLPNDRNDPQKLSKHNGQLNFS